MSVLHISREQDRASHLTASPGTSRGMAVLTVNITGMAHLKSIKFKLTTLYGVKVAF
jgi:hypothetical protein